MDELGLPLSGMAVTLRLSTGAVLNSNVGADGKICLSVPPGTVVEVELALGHEVRGGEATTTPSGTHFSFNGIGP
jgi:hypothetical protein